MKYDAMSDELGGIPRLHLCKIIDQLRAKVRGKGNPVATGDGLQKALRKANQRIEELENEISERKREMNRPDTSQTPPPADPKLITTTAPVAALKKGPASLSTKKKR